MLHCCPYKSSYQRGKGHPSKIFLCPCISRNLNWYNLRKSRWWLYQGQEIGVFYWEVLALFVLKDVPRVERFNHPMSSVADKGEKCLWFSHPSEWVFPTSMMAQPSYVMTDSKTWITYLLHLSMAFFFTNMTLSCKTEEISDL